MRKPYSSHLFLLKVAVALSMTSCADVGDFDDFGSDKKASSGIRRKSTPFVSERDGYHTYRTPSLVKAANGDLLAFAGARDARGDNSRCNVVLRRSTDRGETWEPMQTIVGDPDNMRHRNGLPSPVTLDDGTIVLLYMWSRNVKHNHERGCRKMYMKKSYDHGVTWSRKRDITAQTQRTCEENGSGRIKKKIRRGNWGWTGLGPVHGIVKRQEPHRGRILFAARHVAHDDKSYAHIIYSDDNAETWHIGGSLHEKSSEGTVVELPNGAIMLNARSTGNSTERVVGISYDGGESFERDSDTALDPLIEPGCQGSLLRYGDDILFSNPNDTRRKTNGTLKRSVDGGKTWAFSRVYLSGNRFSGYSDMVEVNGDIGILVEWGRSKDEPHKKIRYLVVPKEEIGIGVSDSAPDTAPASQQGFCAPIEPGHFWVGGTGYFSNGSAYCGLSSFEDWVTSGGPQDGNAPRHDALPECMDYHGICQVARPACEPIEPGHFWVGGTGYFSNGSAYCGLSSFEDWVTSGGPQDGNAPRYDALPECMDYHGICNVD